MTICCHSLFSQESPFNFSGDLRVKYKHFHQKDSNDDDYVFESNFSCKYAEENTWMNTKLKINLHSFNYDSCNPYLSLEKAYAGYRLNENFFIEIGRNNLNDVFESKSQFKSHFNGIHLYFDQDLLNLGKFFAHGGPYIEDYFYNKLAAIAEMGINNLMNSNFDVIYSLVYHPDEAISQMTCKYKLEKFNPYVAYLRNHDSNINSMYCGVSYGKISSAHDIFADVSLHYNDEKCIPLYDLDVLGSGVNGKIVYALTDHLHTQFKTFIAKQGKRTMECSLIYHW